MSLGDGRANLLLNYDLKVTNGFSTIAPAKFPDLHEGDSIPPPATRENSGQVMCYISYWEVLIDLLATRFTRK